MSSQNRKSGGENPDDVSEMSRGANPVPRPSSQSEEIMSLSLPLSIEDLHLRQFLLCLAAEMENEDLKSLKFLTEAYLTPKTTEGLHSSIEYFQQLQRSGIISPNNIILLHALVWLAGRKRLFNLMAEFAKKHGDVLYMCIPNPEPVNGYEYAEIHVKGKRFSSDDLETIRSKLARLMGVPPHCIIVAGVQTTESWLITFMISNIYSTNLVTLVRQHEDWFLGRGIDVFKFGGETVKIPDEIGKKPRERMDESVESEESDEIQKSLETAAPEETNPPVSRHSCQTKATEDQIAEDMQKFCEIETEENPEVVQPPSPLATPSEKVDRQSRYKTDPGCTPGGDSEQNAAFRDFLVKLSREITEDDLKNMKFRLQGQPGIGLADIATCTASLLLFDLLEKRGFLSVKDTAILQPLCKGNVKLQEILNTYKRSKDSDTIALENS